MMTGGTTGGCGGTGPTMTGGTTGGGGGGPGTTAAPTTAETAAAGTAPRLVTIETAPMSSRAGTARSSSPPGSGRRLAFSVETTVSRRPVSLGCASPIAISTWAELSAPITSTAGRIAVAPSGPAVGAVNSSDANRSTAPWTSVSRPAARPTAAEDRAIRRKAGSTLASGSRLARTARPRVVAGSSTPTIRSWTG